MGKEMKKNPWLLLHISISISVLVIASTLFLMLFLTMKESGVNISNKTFFRISFFLLAILLFILTRFLLHFVNWIKFPQIFKKVFFIFLLTPSYLIALIGYFLAYMLQDWREYISFYIISIFHLLRFSPTTYKKIKSLNEGEVSL